MVLAANGRAGDFAALLPQLEELLAHIRKASHRNGGKGGREDGMEGGRSGWDGWQTAESHNPARTHTLCTRCMQAAGPATARLQEVCVGRPESGLTGEAEGRGVMELDNELLVRLWPAERIICGQMVCRSLRAELRKCLRVELKARQKCSVLDLAAANFAQYKASDVKLSLVAKSQHKVIFAAMSRDSAASAWPGPSVLRCRYNNMSAKCSGRLAEMLHAIPALQELDLSENPLLGADISPVALALPACPQLRTLVLQGLGFKPEGSRRLAYAIVQLPALTSLDLRGNRLGSPTGNEGWSRLVAALPRCPRLQNLHLGDNLLMAQGGVALAGVLPSCTRLESLNLCKNSLRGPGAAALADVLPACSTITALDLCGNELGDIGARNLAADLSSCGSLQTLALRGNRISAEGIKRLEEAAANASCLLL